MPLDRSCLSTLGLLMPLDVGDGAAARFWTDRTELGSGGMHRSPCRFTRSAPRAVLLNDPRRWVPGRFSCGIA